MNAFFFFIYKTTNRVNGKIYIGKHKTQDLQDGYLGSGKLLKRAVAKYGRDNFTREILQFCDTEEELNHTEATIVTEQFCNRTDTYNICNGGGGGFSYINRVGLRGRITTSSDLEAARQKLVELRQDPEWKSVDTQSRRDRMIEYNNLRTDNRFKGMSHSEQSKILISDKKKGTGIGTDNSQFGSFWITNGTVSRKIRSNDEIPVDWYKGRVVNTIT